MISLLIKLLWDNIIKNKIPSLKLILGALLAVVTAVLLNQVVFTIDPSLLIETSHLLQIPPLDFGNGIGSVLVSLDFSAIGNPAVCKIAFLIASIAGIETMC